MKDPQIYVDWCLSDREIGKHPAVRAPSQTTGQHSNCEILRTSIITIQHIPVVIR